MLLSFLFSLFHIFLLAQAGRKPKKGRQTVSTVSTASINPAASTVDPSSPRSSFLSTTEALPTPPSTSGAARPKHTDSAIDLFNHDALIGGIICQAKSRFAVLHRPDCMLAAEQVHAPTHRGPGLAIPPTRASSSFRFPSGRGDCEIYVTANYVVSTSRSGIPTLWEPTEVEWIQIWIHVRLRVDMIMDACVGEPGASTEELRSVHGGRGGASGFLIDGVRLSHRTLQSDAHSDNEAPPPGMQLEILLHDGKDLKEMRNEAISQGLMRDTGFD
ncbi:hypothetical protein MMC17_000294 [Xylographa soralifera]|nr:hypothetical protein [Xylographa soralifera]